MLTMIKKMLMMTMMTVRVLSLEVTSLCILICMKSRETVDRKLRFWGEITKLIQITTGGDIGGTEGTVPRKF